MTVTALHTVAEVGISEGAWWVLYELAHADQGLSLVDIVGLTPFSASAVTETSSHPADVRD
ncbi:hypothetical protein BC793_1675 [Actinoplanes xinjiangensis]|uniref:Uncharacterized protein n=1 Tax=Actinoplanes xinjiangensis TaxID=512350 RepID=A0A316EBH1_9ACTN|nr:hypothetical protein BC793_1675 [Actinoplanes xinjiangensis]